MWHINLPQLNNVIFTLIIFLVLFIVWFKCHEYSCCAVVCNIYQCLFGFCWWTIYMLMVRVTRERASLWWISTLRLLFAPELAFVSCWRWLDIKVNLLPFSRIVIGHGMSSKTDIMMGMMGDEKHSFWPPSLYNLHSYSLSTRKIRHAHRGRSHIVALRSSALNSTTPRATVVISSLIIITSLILLHKFVM